jgi:hypothetical protein
MDECSEVSYAHDFSVAPACVEYISEVTFSATDACGNVNTASATYTIQPTTSVNDFSRPVARIAPNPVKDVFRIEIHDLAGAEVQVVFYNALGKIVRELHPGQEPVLIDVEDLNCGLYYIVVSARDFTRCMAVVVEP